MSRFFVLLSVLAMVAFTMGLSGCSESQDTTPTDQEAGENHDEGDGHDHSADDGHDHSADDGHDHSADDGHDHSADDGHDHDAHAGHDHGDVDNSEIEAALAQLSEEDQAAARAQKTCPVTQELLGSMGTPYKVTVNGKEVFLCCQGCEAEIKANPEKYGL